MNSKPSGLKPPSKIGKVTGLAKLNTAGISAAANKTTTANNSVPTRPSGANDSKKIDYDFYNPASPDLALAIFTIDDLPKKKKISDASIIFTENTDDFIIGDRVWVGGTKPGHIQYIGETQFAPGEWAGVVLDDAIGKNDGSVAGVRYFQCEAKRGVFSRLTKLSKEPVQQLIEEEREAAESIFRANGSSATTRVSPTNSLSGGRKPGAVESSPHGSMQNLASAIESGLKTGGRVMVHSATGTKTGVLRYLGSADFAAGEWAGVELDNPVGKNDGSVGGKRYFNCQAKHGLFAPIHKISKASGSGAKKPSGISRPTNVGLGRRTGSQESLNSSVSSASSIARGAARVRLGITSLTSQKTSPRTPVTPLSATHNALQDAFKEKEQHIEQLLKERDLERAEVARAAHQVDEADRKVLALKSENQRNHEENERLVAKLRDVAENADRQRKDLVVQLEEEKRKVEDMQFRMEEEIISKSDLETVTEADAQKIQQLARSLKDEQKRSERLEQESQKLFQAEESVARLTDEVEQVRSRLGAAENRTKILESCKDEVGEKASKTAFELNEKETKVRELENLLRAKDKDHNELKMTLRKTEEDLERTKQSQQKDQDNIESVQSKLGHLQTQVENFTKDNQELQLSNSDLQRKLQASDEKCDQASQQKTKIEQDLEELMRSKGDSSVQLSKMNEQLRERERHCEELHSQLQTASHETASLQERLVQCQQQAASQVASIKDRHDDETKALGDQLRNAESGVRRLQERISEMNDRHNEDQEKLCSRKDNEIMELKNKIQMRDNEIVQVNNQLGDVRNRFEMGQQQQEETRINFEQQLREAKAAKEKLLHDKEESERNNAATKQKLTQIETQKERYLLQQRETEAAVREKDAKVSVLTAEVDRLRSEFGNHRLDLQRKLAETELEVQTMNEMHNQLELQNRLIDDLQHRLTLTEKENEEQQATIAKLNLLHAQNSELESSSATMKKELEDMKHKEMELKVLFETEKDSTHQLLEANENLIAQQKRELEQNQRELATSKNQNAKASVMESLLKELETEKRTLQGKATELQAALDESKRKQAEDASNASVPEEDKDAQISFLNSVIVDMQKKVDELRVANQRLEAGSPVREPDINLNGIKAKVLPRLFCDICDTFDLHDTEDCPRQASSDSPTPSQNHGNRNQVRPYCDICEVFGHWTNQCNDDETY